MRNKEDRRKLIKGLSEIPCANLDKKHYMTLVSIKKNKFKLICWECYIELGVMHEMEGDIK
jgi:hypothetical protein